MSELSANQLLKDRKLWPSKNEESWKYFDINKFEDLTESAILSTDKPEIIFTKDTSSEIKISPKHIQVSENIKSIVNIEVIRVLDLINTNSNLDFRFTTLNRENYGLSLEIIDQKDFNLKIIYDDQKNILNTFVKLNVVSSDLTLIEEDLTCGTSLFSTHTQIEIKNSKVEHIVLFANSGSDVPSLQAKIYNSEIYVSEKSFYNNICVFLKNKLIRAQQSLCLSHESSSGRLNAFNISEEKNFSELRTEVLHLEPKTESRQLFKTISADQAQSVFNGRIFVDSKAQKTDAAQLCQGILLNEKAIINAKPELEIYADDVKAAHGAAIGQLGHDQIFYLVSRGIKPETAYRILSKAFAGEVLSSIESLKIRAMCQQVIEQSSQTVFEKLALSINDSGSK